MESACIHPFDKVDWGSFSKDERFFMFNCTKCGMIIGFTINPKLLGHSEPMPYKSDT
jgi:hypothetical protein